MTRVGSQRYRKKEEKEKRNKHTNRKHIILQILTLICYIRRARKMFEKDYYLSHTLSDRLLNKYTNCKGIENNTSFRQITGIQEKLDTTCK